MRQLVIAVLFAVGGCATAPGGHYVYPRPEAAACVKSGISSALDQAPCIVSGTTGPKKPDAAVCIAGAVAGAQKLINACWPDAVWVADPPAAPAK